ncbi:MAG: hypothetical protein L0H63_02980 [Nitrococcus sp.]|nr:hypothetical protein [Nitrococcus sp.]
MLLTEPWWLASFARLVDFQAVEPFQHRLLVPAIVSSLGSVLPLGTELLFALVEVAGWMALVIVAHRALVMFEIGKSDLLRRMLAFTVIVPMALHLIAPDLHFVSAYSEVGGAFELGDSRAQPQFYYSYDLPAAVFTLALFLLVVKFARSRSRRWFAAYLGLFALATLNRETTLFLIPIFFASCYRILGSRALATTMILQISVFVAIQGTLQWLFADHVNPHAGIPGTQYELHLWTNLALFDDPLYLITYLARLGAGLYIPVVLLRSHLDPLLGRSLLLLGIPLFVSALLFGRLQEHRVIIEVMPLLWLGAIQAAAAWSASSTATAAISPYVRCRSRSSGRASALAARRPRPAAAASKRTAAVVNRNTDA